MASDLFERVYEVVGQIPAGRVVTYGQIGLRLGMPRGGRTVGWAMKHCPAHLPWHRVVNARGAISASPESPRGMMQRQRLEEEGVVFDASGGISLKAYGWRDI